jgi:excisionase family DNA binding protein
MLKPRLMTVEQAGIYLGGTVDATRELVKRGVLPVVKGDGRVMFDIKDLDQWIDQNTVTA